jgi:hypothetical protein
VLVGYSAIYSLNTRSKFKPGYRVTLLGVPVVFFKGRNINTLRANEISPRPLFPCPFEFVIY